MACMAMISTDSQIYHPRSIEGPPQVLQSGKVVSLLTQRKTQLQRGASVEGFCLIICACLRADWPVRRFACVICSKWPGSGPQVSCTDMTALSGSMFFKKNYRLYIIMRETMMQP